MRSRLLILTLAAGLALGFLAAGDHASGQSRAKPRKWQYTTLRHSPYLKKGGSDLAKIQEMGAKGWELAASYPVKGEIVVSIFKRSK